LTLTTNANESKTRDHYSKVMRQKTNGGSVDHNKCKENKGKPRDNGSRAKNGYTKPGNLREHNRNASHYGKNFDKDEEEENKGARSHRASDARAKSAQTKGKDQPFDKMETMKRLEREKKALQKKSRDEEEERMPRTMVKQRKNSKNDWTKSYQSGILEDDEDYSEY
jgi:hypothetical protein